MALLLNELEEAFAALARTAGANATVYTGRASSEKLVPLCICSAEGEAEEDPKGSGNFWVNMLVQTKASLGTETDNLDPKPADVLLAQTIFSVFLVDNLDTQLNAQGRTLTIFPTAYIVGSPRQSQDEAGKWFDELPIRVYCCASVLAP